MTVRVLVLNAICCLGLLSASPALAQKQLTLRTSFGAEFPGAMTVVWIDEDVLIGGMDYAIRRYAIPDTSNNIELIDSFVESSRHMSLAERAGATLSLAVTQDKRRFIAGGSDYQARLWNLDRGQVIPAPSKVQVQLTASQRRRPPQGNDASVPLLAALYPDPSAGNAQISVWKVTDELLSSPQDFSIRDAMSIELMNPGIQTLLTAQTRGGQLEIRNVSGESIHETIFSTDAKSVDPGARFVDDASKVLWTCNSEDHPKGRELYLREWKTDRRQPDWLSPKAASWALSGDQKSLVTWDGGTKITLWKVSSDAAPAMIASAAESISPNTLAIAYDGKRFAYIDGTTATITIVKPKDGGFSKEVNDLKLPEGEATQLALSDDGELLSACDELGNIYVIAVSSLDPDHPAWKCVGSQSAARTILKFLPETHCFVSAGSSTKLYLWDGDSHSLADVVDLEQQVRTLQCSKPSKSGEVQIVTGLCSTSITAASSDVSINTVDIKSKTIAVPTGGAKTLAVPDIVSLALSSTGEHLLTTSSDGVGRYWNLTSKVPILKQRSPVYDKMLGAELLDDNLTVLSLSVGSSFGAWRVIAGEAWVVEDDRMMSPLLVFANEVMGNRTVTVYATDNQGQNVNWNRYGDQAGDTLQKGSLVGHKDKVNAANIAFADAIDTVANQNGPVPYVVTGSADKTVRVWDFLSGQLLYTLATQEAVNCQSVLDCIVVSGSTSAGYSVADILVSEPLSMIDQFRVTPATAANMTTVAVLPNGLAFGFADGIIRTRRTHAVSTVGTSAALKLDGQTSISTTDPISGISLTNKAIHAGQVYSVAWSADASRAATGSADGCVRIWDGNLKAVKYCLQHPIDGEPFEAVKFNQPFIQPADQTDLWTDNPVYTVVFGKDSNTLISQVTRSEARTLTNAPGSIAIWTIPSDANSTVTVRTINPPSNIVLTSLAEFGGQWLAAGTRKGHVLIWDYSQSTIPEPKDLQLESGVGNPIYGLSFSKQGKLAAISSSGGIAIWDHSADWTQIGAISAAAAVPNASFSNIAWNSKESKIVVTCLPVATAPAAPAAPTALLFDFR